MSTYPSIPVKILALVGLLWSSASPAVAQPSSPDVVLIIPHTHWEGAVFKTREEYLEVGLPNILKALYLLKKYPNYRFVLDQMCYIRPFLERYPSEAAAFREFLAQGRLQIAGGTDTMHDNNTPSGESIVRQYLLGKSYFREKLGYDVTTGWALDTFGHNAQMPQILKLAGMKSYWFQRGVSSPDTPSEFLWQGIDGTQIPAFWLPIGYGALYDLPAMNRNLTRYSNLASIALRLIPAATNAFSWPEPMSLSPKRSFPSWWTNSTTEARSLLPLISPFLPISKRRCTSTNRPVIQGELNPVFQGVYSSRIEVKQHIRK